MLVLDGSLLIGQERKTRDELVRDDLAEVTAERFWIYNDLAKGVQIAQQSGKPLLVVFRCIPCEACAQLDSEIVERDAAVRDLLFKFVCVRIVHANGMDLSLFQFDYDQSFAAFMLNADKTIYGRYGTRSHQTESADDVSIEGFAEALRAALDLHEQYPANRAALTGKQPTEKPLYPVPEAFPGLKDNYKATLAYDGQVARSCIHCHQVGEAVRDVNRAKPQPIADRVLFPYPHPKALGLIMDPRQRATLLRVTPDSMAARSGFQPGDRLVSLADQPLVSTADIQWVLHNAPETGSLVAQVQRGDERLSIELDLPDQWRQLDDISWRATSWALRRMFTGGLLLEEATPEVRRSSQIAPDALALVVRHVGQYGPHALAKSAGFQKDDVIVAVKGETGRMRESDLFRLLASETRVGDEVPFTVARGADRLELTLRMQE
jgi:hypothetical protein